MIMYVIVQACRTAAVTGVPSYKQKLWYKKKGKNYYKTHVYELLLL